MFSHFSVEVHKPVWSVREADCVTRPAYPSHHCVLQDITVLQGPLLLALALRLVCAGGVVVFVSAFLGQLFDLYLLFLHFNLICLSLIHFT